MKRRTVIFGIDSLEAGLDAFSTAWNTGEAEADARISFGTLGQFWKVMTAKRWELLKAIAGRGPISIHDVAKDLTRSVRAVRGDARALVMAGVLPRAEDDKICFPYDAVHVDFWLAVER